MYSRELHDQKGEVTYGYPAREIDNERSAVDRSGAARGPLSVCRWRETGPAARPNDGAGGAARLVLEIPRRGRGARRARPGPPRASAHPAGPDPAGRGGAGDHHDRSRSEEHTSELQSPYDRVCRLLLEKKKTVLYRALCADDQARSHVDVCV